jgi:hypothetical protein
MQIINFHGDKKEMLVDVPHNNQATVESRILGGRQMFFLPREFFQQSTFRNLSHAGFNVKLLDTSERMDFFNQGLRVCDSTPSIRSVSSVENG